MWDGHYSFWFQLQDGNTAIWRELSNEHRLLLLIAVFSLDLAVLSGSTPFLFVVNLILLALLTVVLILQLGQRLAEFDGWQSTLLRYVIQAGIVVTIVTAWMQGEDLTIGNHAQWVLTLTNGSGTIVGFVDMGKPRPDVLNEFPDASGLNGYTGYLDRSAVSSEFFVVDDAFRCSNTLTSAVP